MSTRISAVIPAVLVVAAAGLLAACGSSSTSSSSGGASSSSIVFTGDITGTWQKGGDASLTTCSSSFDDIHIVGPTSGDEGRLRVGSDGSILVDIEKYGDFTATSGATFKATQGFTINADVTTTRGKKAHVSGSLGC